MQYEFNDSYVVVGTMPGVFTLEELEKEQGMYSATPEFAWEHGGPITHQLLGLIPRDYKNEADKLGLFLNIDVRVHRLYPGNFPAYPGWHCDAQFRETFFAQPRSERTQLSNHLIATISSDEEGISRTEFMAQPLNLYIPNYDPEEGEVFWKLVDSEIRKLDSFESWTMPDGALTRFDCWTLHRCTPATKRGWRLFFRVAMWYRPNLDGGKLSRQEMLYVDTSAGTGW